VTERSEAIRLLTELQAKNTSLTEALDTLDGAFTAQTHILVKTSYAASSVLAKQIEAGAARLAGDDLRPQRLFGVVVRRRHFRIIEEHQPSQCRGHDCRPCLTCQYCCNATC
jgi:hypothetical protein